MRNLVLSAIILATMVGCGTTPSTTTTYKDSKGHTVRETTVVEKSQKTLRKEKKHNLVKVLCKTEATLYNDQRMVVQTAPTIIQDGRVVEIPEEQRTVFYNPAVPPFNMQGCIEEGLRWPGERLVSRALGVLENVVVTGVRYGAPAAALYGVVNSITKRGGTKVDAQPGSSVAVSDQESASVDNSARGTCPGEVDSGTGLCVTPPPEEPEPELEPELEPEEEE